MRNLRQECYAKERTCICGLQFNSVGRLITHCIREQGRDYYCEDSAHYPRAINEMDRPINA